MRKTSRILAALFCVLMLISSVSAVSFAASKKPAATKKISTSVTATSIKLTWSKVSGASGYRVYQYKDKKWVAVKSSTTSNTYTVKSLIPATSYKFSVKTYKKSGGKTYWSDSKRITVKTAAVSNTKSVKATALDNCKVKLSWDKVSSAGGYVVYRYADGEWKKLKSTTATSYTVSGLNAKTTYKFLVKTYLKASGKYYYSSGKSVSVKTGALSVGKVMEMDVVPTSDTVKLSWVSDGNITGYRVYMFDESVQKYNTLATIKTTEYTVKDLEGSMEYNFVVRPYAKSGSTTVWGDKYTVDTKTLLSAPGAITATVSGSEATVLWSASDNVDGYEIYLYDEREDSFTEFVDAVEDNYFTYTIPAGKKVTLGVLAYSENENGKIDRSSVRSITLGGANYYKNIFKTGQYGFTTEIEGYDTDIYYKNGNTHVRTVMPISDGLDADCKIIYNKSKDKTIALMSITGFGGFYCNDIEAIAGSEMDLSSVDAYNVRFTKSEPVSETVITEITYGDKTLISECYEDKDGNTVIFYFEDGKIVKHDIIRPDGTVDSLIVRNVSSSVSDSKFNVTPPWNYINIDSFIS